MMAGEGVTSTRVEELLRRIQDARGTPGDLNRAASAWIDELRSEVTRTGTPLHVDESRTVFVYFGDPALSSVGLLGDMNSWEYAEPMFRVPHTGFFYLAKVFEPDARLEYLVVPGDLPGPVTDPLNPYVVLDGLGGHSELAMPGYRRHPLFLPFEGGKKADYGRVRRFELPPGALPYPHEIFIYLPPGYAGGDASYPTIYLHDGKDYIEFAAITHVLDGLIRAGTIEPVIAVLISPPNRHSGETPNRATEYGLNEAYISFCAEELRSWVDQNYRTRRSPADRLIAGASFGGLTSFHAAFQRPDVFGNAYCQSSYFSFRDDAIRRAAEISPRQPIRLFLDTGTYEWIVGPEFIPPPERDFVRGNQRMRATLERKGYEIIYREYHEGHTWGNWRAHLIDALTFFFGRSPRIP